VLEEKTYRKMISDAFEHILNTLDNVDPDVVEAELNQGTLLLQNSKTKIVLSPQPPVRQLWLAAAGLGIAAHFVWSAEKKLWFEDKAPNKEFYTFLEEVIFKSFDTKIHFDLVRT